MTPPLKITLNNCLDALPAHIEAMETHLKSQGVNEHDIYRSEIIVEELVTNTIKYGYKDSQTHEISIELILTADSIHLLITDDADPFDPTVPPPQEANTLSPLKKREIGGLGLLLVKKFANTFSYKRIGKKNQQTVTLKRSKT